MPAIVGNVKFVSVGSSSVVQFGDALVLAPISTTKTFAGSGSFITGDLPVTNNGLSNTLTNDTDAIDTSAGKGSGIG
ncbi:spore germination protein [Xylanibacillus composti]|uniref:Germination protein PA n=1 Tax=Xylanibacillus composti TaxID=1572762 RepID=A0A8J4H342_9BACL|nr:spore germination protein [Xylanibacillus composti]MDT9723944.1 spore germination protein [Xylanibacillus composti]GIQ67823.1 germination protein PA [Xylanibacillus composti]